MESLVTQTNFHIFIHPVCWPKILQNEFATRTFTASEILVIKTAKPETKESHPLASSEDDILSIMLPPC